jgi:hypothetical protein
MVRVQIQPRNLIDRRQHGTQLQLCVPQVQTSGDSIRLTQALAGKGVTPLN